MIIYHGITTWHILECWVHKLKYHKDENAILILPDFIQDKFPDIKWSFPKDIFDIRIIRYMKLNYRVDDNQFENELKRTIDELKISNILSADEIYVAGGQYAFSHYLIQNQVKFHFFEEAPGRLTTAEIVMGNLKKINEKQYNMALNDGMFVGNSEMVKTIIGNAAAQVKESVLPENFEDFDVIDAIHTISADDLKQIKDYFSVPEVNFSENSAMILTQHFANLEMLTYIEQALLYQMTVDYYLPNDKIYVKPHPDDLMSYKSELPDCEVIHGRFPSELLHVISDTRPEKLLAISSSSILNLNKYYKNIIGFNEEYLETFYYNHQYYLAAKIVKMIGADKKITGENINFIQFNNMLDVVINNKNCCHCDEHPKKSDICIIGKDADIENLKKHYNRKCVYIFLDPQSWYEFAGSKQKCFKNGICKPIKLSAMYEQYEEGVFYLYIYCENRNIKREIAEMNYAKKLINTGIETTVPKTDDKDVEIAVLKGILKATETRLQYYIEQEKAKEK